ncbi:hypothetical protein MLD38_023380 [Melastoma candidum]|uniref:Uncharacterized protein n=1 Tax=Melastoma candidum TaxID=119954 RepID=A0ACB9QMW8_9MYRT|nr:hypothetical protein MLD38_023380 [Melastoma candidum]
MDDELEELVQYLEVNGVRRDWMEYVMCRAPSLLCCSMEELKSRVGFYLVMGMNVKDFGTMVYDYPWALGGFTIEEMNQQVNYLKEFGLSNEELGRLLAFKPHLMGSSIENRLKPLVKFLYYLDQPESNFIKVRFFRDIGIQDNAIGDMLVKFPPLLTYDLKRKIQRVVIFLITRAGINEKDVAKVDVIEFPRFFSYSLEGRIMPRHKVLVENRLNMKLRNMLACTDGEFEQNVRDAVERRWQFESRVSNETALNLDADAWSDAPESPDLSSG